MAYSRIVGQNIDLMMRKKGIQASMISEKLGYSERDVHRIIEGVLLVDGTELKNIAGVFGADVQELLKERTEEEYRELLHCMGTYKSTENKDKILDYIDLYITLEESVR